MVLCPYKLNILLKPKHEFEIALKNMLASVNKDRHQTTYLHSPELLLVLVAPRQGFCYPPILQTLPYPTHMDKCVHIDQVSNVLFRC
jgi:hypothetical protein